MFYRNTQDYYHLHHDSFCTHVKAVVDALEKILELKGDQVTEQQRAAVRGVKISNAILQVEL